MTAEEWRPVVGFPGYAVSSEGRVMSFKRKQPRELVGGTTGRLPYRIVGLFGPDGERHMMLVHRLVARAFHGPSPDGLVVRHLDGDLRNNSAANLRYGTHSENNYDVVRHGRNRNANKTSCRNGHPLDDRNTYRHGWSRHCRTCRAAADQRYRERRAFRAAGVSA